MSGAECPVPNGKCRMPGSVGRVVIALLSVMLTCSGRAFAAPAKAEDEIPPRLDSAVARGLTFLARQQNADGSFDGGAPKVATTGLAVLAFLGAGETPGLGKHGLVVQNAIEFLLGKQAADGYFGTGDRGMYAHGIATLALAEAYGVESLAGSARVRTHAALEKAVAVIVAAQNVAKSSPAFAGGWRYERNSTDSDLSLSGWNALALQACQADGLEVPKEARQHAIEFVLRCFDANGKGFAYQPGGGAQAGDTGIGICCLHVLGAAESHAAKMDAATQFLVAHPIDDAAPYPYYATYYITQAAFQRDAEAWARAGRPALERLIRTQDKDGGWPIPKGSQEPGRVYASTMAVQTLTIPYRLLPINQR